MKKCKHILKEIAKIKKKVNKEGYLVNSAVWNKADGQMTTLVHNINNLQKDIMSIKDIMLNQGVMANEGWNKKLEERYLVILKDWKNIKKDLYDATSTASVWDSIQNFYGLVLYGGLVLFCAPTLKLAIGNCLGLAFLKRWKWRKGLPPLVERVEF